MEGFAPDGRVIDRDLNATAIPPINAEWVGAVYTPEQARTSAAEEIAFSLRLLSPNWSRPRVTHRMPMHNFGVPSVLKL